MHRAYYWVRVFALGKSGEAFRGVPIRILNETQPQRHFGNQYLLLVSLSGRWGYKVGLYCSDVSGAFDRVNREILVGKLAYSGLNLRVVKFLASWLEDRRSSVIVSGAQSVAAVLTDSVHQGTVLRPPWFCKKKKCFIRTLLLL